MNKLKNITVIPQKVSILNVYKYVNNVQKLVQTTDPDGIIVKKNKISHRFLSLRKTEQDRKRLKMVKLYAFILFISESAFLGCQS